ncbi:FecR family protein [Pedobacter miscanthi]|uniref:FecR family protein n=1 Tax=Pedobacter miscanthi TaxID=2259170 RepID=UPI00292EAE36|nr:FecR domain-containing protein [Pedobacter miscanthi]
MPFFELSIKEVKMDQQRQRIIDLLYRYNHGEISGPEQAELIAWYDSFDGDPLFTEGLSKEYIVQVKQDEFRQVSSRIEQELVLMPVANKIRMKTSIRWAIAASVLICTFLGGYFMLSKPAVTELASQKKQMDFPAGKNKAILTLAGNKEIILDDTQNGELAEQDNTLIRKTADGQVVYEDRHAAHAPGQVLINTMTTPRGGQYHLTLADGTEVWLNAASSITYPTAFTANDRQVEITGEVYFQVAHLAKRPFRVKSNGQTVEVLGTHFDVNAYGNENAIRTTLLEGSVEVTANGQKTLLKPGQQAVWSSASLRKRNADVDEAVAWKDGYFHFVDADIQTIMRQFARWYDVDIEFEGPITNETFTGRLPRSWSLNRVMKIVESSRSVYLKVEGRRIMVKM